MKKILITLFVAAQAFAITAQKSTIDKVANAACDCINNAELDESMTQQDAEVFLGQCMAPSIMENMDALMKEMKLKETENRVIFVSPSLGLQLRAQFGGITSATKTLILKHIPENTSQVMVPFVTR